MVSDVQWRKILLWPRAKVWQTNSGQSVPTPESLQILTKPKPNLDAQWLAPVFFWNMEMRLAGQKHDVLTVQLILRKRHTHSEGWLEANWRLQDDSNVQSIVIGIQKMPEPQRWESRIIQSQLLRLINGQSMASIWYTEWPTWFWPLIHFRWPEVNQRLAKSQTY